MKQPNQELHKLHDAISYKLYNSSKDRGYILNCTIRTVYYLHGWLNTYNVNANVNVQDIGYNNVNSLFSLF